MDQKGSPSWRTQSLNLFGKNPQLGLKEKHTDKPSDNNRESPKSMEFETYVTADRRNSRVSQRGGNITSQTNNEAGRQNFAGIQKSKRSVTAGIGSSQNTGLDEGDPRDFAKFGGRSITNLNQSHILPPPQTLHQRATHNGNIIQSGTVGRRWNSFHAEGGKSITNLNQNKRHIVPPSQTLQQRATDKGNSSQSGAVRKRRHSANASQINGNANPNLNEKQPVRSNSNSVLNQGQSNANRNQRSENNERNKGQSFENRNFQRRKQNHQTFFGFKKFENYLNKEADSVVISLHSEIEEFERFLKENRAYEGNLFNTLLTVLSEKVFSDESNLVSYPNDIVRLLATTEIINRFRDKCMTLEESKFKFMYNIADFMKRRMPLSAADSLSGVVSFCIARLGMTKNNPESAALLEQFQILFQSFQEKRQHEEFEAKARKAPVRGKFTDYDLISFDKLKPPNDFRHISIIPSVEEAEPSFLRPNKQSGSYADAEHYLDVQFRLLREDFVQPLKQGIQEFLALRQKTTHPRMPKGSSIRLYYNVKCLTAEVKNENLDYWIQLHSDCSKIQWDKSRRLLPGSLVLLTENSGSFDSVAFAAVGLRNDDDLKKHRKLTIIPENTISTSNVDILCDGTDLMLIESEVYWESYRHVLKTAQTLNLNTFPLTKYIVRASTDVRPPPSLFAPNEIIARQLKLQNDTIDPLINQTWPRADMLGLDANQFEAFKAAFTKQFVIIQGPPGTGKHLLFLEGILKIMHTHNMDPKIVRVGGRSKSEILGESNLRDIARRTTRHTEGLQWREMKDIELKMKQNQASIKTKKQIIAELERPTGIVQFEELDDIVYQILCLEFSFQLMDKFSSPSFFKLTQSDVCKIKENNASDVVKKWFEYLNVKSSKNTKVAHAKDIRQEVPEVQTDVDIEEIYDMDELMEHRIITEYDHDKFELKFRLENGIGVARFHVQNMSMLQSECLLKEYELTIQTLIINDNDPLNVVYEKQRQEANVRENETAERERFAILSEIFRCLNEKVVRIPDVEKELQLLRNFSISDPNNVVDTTFPLIAQRYAAYLVVAKRAKQLMQQIVRKIEAEMIEWAGIIAQFRRQHDVQILKDAAVVGMSTTGAAKFNDLLVKMKSRIVIVEEAAEVLEAHIVTSLTKYTDHLILIGDHKQLKPSTTVYDLSRKYDLDVSLFERMINNNMTCYSLLSSLPNLNDASNVHKYESITGMTKDLFFLAHDKFEKSEGDSLSKLNEFEADFLAGLAGYLLKQGYLPSSITVLTTYTGQMFILKSKFRTSESLQRIQITCVDNFQGEENDIILLSLVRSNPEGKMGFLSVSNRVCVALSRAKKGLYIVGNMKMLAKQTIWSEINYKLEKRGEVGTVMKVVCQPHKTQTEISKGDDFIKKCPEGGCSKMCGVLMKCSHYCPRFCHAQDLNHEDYVCREHCRKPCLSEQAQSCTRQCHFGKVCMPCDVQVEKSRSCGHDIFVSCHKSVEEAYCRTKVKKLLKCDHEMKVDCSQIMNDWLCRQIVDKVLACGHESKLMCHVNPDQYQCNIMVKKKLPCTHYRNMKCFEVPASSMCKTFLDKQLPCGHSETIECRFDPKEVTCKVKVAVTLECDHSLEVSCFQKTKKGKIGCVELCEERLSCGHSCPLKCHYFMDRHYDKFRCKKPCAKTCPEGHRCLTNHECATKCKKCVTIVEALPDCGHIGKMYCFESLSNYNCQEQCGKMLLCGHSCRKKCSEPCGSCKEMTTKQVLICGHNQLVACNEYPVPENCKEKIEKRQTICGHEIIVACNMRNSSVEEIQTYCTRPCEYMFPAENGCGHKCSGTCGTCLMGSLHQKCKEKCLRLLICGHLCNFPCVKNCPPCSGKCQMKCEHSKCKKMCGDACFICKERCTWKCKHKRCTKLCGEMCNRDPCDEPCDRKLLCGHLCIGFCGEMCPPLCRNCNMDKLTEFQLLYTKDENDARFIWLPDCKHTIEVDGLTMHFNASNDSGEIGLKKCPRCTTVITTLSGRFGNIILKTFQDVANVKNKFYGNREQNQRLVEEIQHNLQIEEHNLKKHLPSVKKFYEKILYFEVEPKAETSEMKLRMCDIQTLNSLQQVWVWVKEIIKNLIVYSDNVIQISVDSMFGNIENRQLPLCAFEVNNISNEIQRLAHKIQFHHRWNTAPQVARDQSEAKKLHIKILDTLTAKGFYIEKSQREVVESTKNLEKILKTGVGISEVERMAVVKALNMKQGHWFKCPNGHFYVIGDCGGAMETAKCNECGATIGGANHSLLGINQFAPEMDGAARPAWDTVMFPQNFGF